MNYESSKNFSVAGNGQESITVATYENGLVVLVAVKSTEYMNEQSVDIPLTDSAQVEALIEELQAVRHQLTGT